MSKGGGGGKGPGGGGGRDAAGEMVSEGAAEMGTLFREQCTPPRPPSAHRT